MKGLSDDSPGFDKIRKYVATAPNSVINATAMLDCVKRLTMKPSALVLCSTLLNLPGTFSEL